MARPRIKERDYLLEEGVSKAMPSTPITIVSFSLKHFQNYVPCFQPLSLAVKFVYDFAVLKSAAQLHVNFAEPRRFYVSDRVQGGQIKIFGGGQVFRSWFPVTKETFIWFPAFPVSKQALYFFAPCYFKKSSIIVFPLENLVYICARTGSHKGQSGHPSVSLPFRHLKSLNGRVTILQ